MKTNNYTTLIYVLGIICVIIGCISCNDVAPYKQYVGNKEVSYPQKIDTVIALGGINKVILKIPKPIDPLVSKVGIFWNNKEDSVKAMFPSDKDTLEIEIDSLKVSGGVTQRYIFSVYTYNHTGNKSIKFEEGVMVLGKDYINTIENRSIKKIIVDPPIHTLTINWEDASPGSIGTIVKFTNTSNEADSILVSNDSNKIDITNYKRDSVVKYYALYTTAIDTFSTNIDTVRMRYLESKKGWTAKASSYDQRKGNARSPSSAIDNDPSTIWVNQITPQTYYPHSITIDMSSVRSISGLTFRVQQRDETPKLIKVLISVDGSNWILLGKFTVKNTPISITQFIDFNKSFEVRYFKVIAIKDYNPKNNNIVIPEIGAYTSPGFAK
jgi:hypothetical protein